MNLKVIDSVWFGQIGIVAIQSGEDKWKAYIGSAFSGSQYEDEQFVAKLGKPTGKGIAVGAFPDLDPDKFTI